MHFYYSYPFKIAGLDHKLDSHRIQKYFMHNQQDFDQLSSDQLILAAGKLMDI